MHVTSVWTYGSKCGVNGVDEVIRMHHVSRNHFVSVGVRTRSRSSDYVTFLHLELLLSSNIQSILYRYHSICKRDLHRVFIYLKQMRVQDHRNVNSAVCYLLHCTVKLAN